MLNPFRSVIAGFVFLSAAVAWSAEPPTPGSPPLRDPARSAVRDDDRAQATTPVRAGSVDEFMASCLCKSNQAEITLAKLAQQRASNAQVKAFAEQMIKEHGEFLAKLECINSGVRPNTAPEPNATTLPARPGTAALAPRVDVAPTRTSSGGGASATLEQMAQIGNEIAERCLASAQRELEQKDGADFDRCYMGMQIGAHMKMVDELTVFKKHASAELGRALGEGLHTSEEHLLQAKKIAKHLETLPAATATRPSEDTRK